MTTFSKAFGQTLLASALLGLGSAAVAAPSTDSTSTAKPTDAPLTLVVGMFYAANDVCPEKLTGQDLKDVENLLAASLVVPELGAKPAKDIDITNLSKPGKDSQQSVMDNLMGLSFIHTGVKSLYGKNPDAVCGPESAYKKDLAEVLSKYRNDGSAQLAEKIVKTMPTLVKKKAPDSAKQTKPAPKAVKPGTEMDLP